VAICLLDKTLPLFNLDENKDRFWIKSEDDFKALYELLRFVKDEKSKNPGSLILSYPAIDFISKYFKDPVQKEILCASSQDRVFIDPSGNLFGGCLAMGEFGNVGRTPLSDITGKKPYRDARKNMFFKRCQGCSCGYLFNIKCDPRLILKDILMRVSPLGPKNG